MDLLKLGHATGPADKEEAIVVSGQLRRALEALSHRAFPHESPLYTTWQVT